MNSVDRCCGGCRAQRDYLGQKLEEADAKLRDARAERKESERDRRMADAVEQLKRFFPGAARARLPLHAYCNLAGCSSPLQDHPCSSQRVCMM
jgi:hypothetical protein